MRQGRERGQPIRGTAKEGAELAAALDRLTPSITGADDGRRFRRGVVQRKAEPPDRIVYVLGIKPADDEPARHLKLKRGSLAIPPVEGPPPIGTEPSW